MGAALKVIYLYLYFLLRTSICVCVCVCVCMCACVCHRIISDQVDRAETVERSRSLTALICFCIGLSNEIYYSNMSECM